MDIIHNNTTYKMLWGWCLDNDDRSRYGPDTAFRAFLETTDADSASDDHDDDHNDYDYEL